MGFYRNKKRCDTCAKCKVCTYMKYATAQNTTVNQRVKKITCANCPCMDRFGNCLRATKTGCKNHEEIK